MKVILGFAPCVGAWFLFDDWRMYLGAFLMVFSHEIFEHFFD